MTDKPTTLHRPRPGTREILIVVLIVLAAAGLRWERLGTRNLWQDEAYSLDLARRTIPEILTALRTQDAHPVGYYAMLSLWIRAVGEDLARMRLLSAVFGLGGVVFAWALGRLLFSPVVGIGAAALVALNPFQIFASNELRMYMPLQFMMLVSTWVLWRAGESSRGLRWWVAYGVTVALMAYLSYYAALVVAAHALWVMWRRGWRGAVVPLLVAGVTAFIVYAPWIPFLAHLIRLAGYDPLRVRGAQAFWATYVPEVVASQTFGGYMFNMLTYHTTRGMPLHYYGIFLLPFLFLIAAGYRALGRINASGRALIALSWTVPIALVVVGSLLAHRVLAYPYHLTFLQPLLAICVAAGVVHLRDAIVEAPATLAPMATVIVILAFIGPALHNLQSNPNYQYYRYDLAARMVKRLHQPGDVVIYLPNAVRKGFSFYFDPPGKELGIGVEITGWSRDALRGSIQQVVRSLEPADARVWIVYLLPLPERALDDLVAALEQAGYRRAPINDFAGIYVGLMVRPQR